MRTIEIGKSAGSVDIALIIVRGVERGVAGGSSVSGFGPGVGRLEVTTRPATRKSGLQGGVVRIGIVGEELVAGIAVEARSRSARNGVGKGIRGDLKWGAVGRGNGDRIGRSGVERLNGVACFAEMDGMGTDITDFENPAFAEGTLNGEVPL